MKFKVIGSGSKGNMTYIESKECKLLLDAGINLKEIAKRSDIDLTDIDGILITHEHIDHISSLQLIIKKTKCKVYMNRDSYEAMVNKYPGKYEKINVCFIDANTKYKIKDIMLMPIQLSHDTVSCYGYIFVSNKESLGYITDTGFIPIPYFDILNRLDTIIIESNHDIEMLQNSDRPWVLKQRILSVHGHMSNIMCGEALNKILRTKNLKNVVLAHLSEECNDEKIAIDTILESIEGDYIPNIFVAKQYESLDFLEVKPK